MHDHFAFLVVQDATAKVANASKQHWQWEAEQPDGETSMMLNTDFEIFFNLELDQNGKTVCKLEPNCVQDGSCGKNNLCAKADTYEQGHEYIKVSLLTAMASARWMFYSG